MLGKLLFLEFVLISFFWFFFINDDYLVIWVWVVYWMIGLIVICIVLCVVFIFFFFKGRILFCNLISFVGMVVFVFYS